MRRGTASEATSDNPILHAGEIGVELDSGKFKIGDGSTAWNDLLYATDVSRLPHAVVSVTGLAAATGYKLLSTATDSNEGEWVPDTSATAPVYLAYLQYDPSPVGAAYPAPSAAADMDATNLKVTFTAPASGKVLVELSAFALTDAGHVLMWGVREGSSDVTTEYARVQQSGVGGTAIARFLITGLTPGDSHTYKWGHFYQGGSGPETFMGPLSGTPVGPGIMTVLDPEGVSGGGGGGGGGVTQLVAGAGVSLSPSGGTGAVTVSASASGPIHTTSFEAHGAVGNDPSHDDAPAIEAAIFAVVAACIADESYICRVTYDAEKLYYAKRDPISDQVVGGVHSYAYAQISLPFVPFTWDGEADPVVTIVLEPSEPKAIFTDGFAAAPCAIETTITAFGPAATNFCSVFGANGAANGNAQNGIKLAGHLSIIVPPNCPIGGLDTWNLWGVDMDTVRVYQPTAGYVGWNDDGSGGNEAWNTNLTAYGVRLPRPSNSGMVRIRDLQVTGMFLGVAFCEHAKGDYWWIYGNRIGLMPASDGVHPAAVMMLEPAWNKYVFAGQSGPDPIDLTAANAVPLVVTDLSVEANQNFILDANNHGRINARVGPNSGEPGPITGARNCHFKNMNYPSGAIASPVVPAASTPQPVIDGSAMQVWRDCMIAVHGGTAVEVSIDGVDTGLSSGTFLVPAGKTFALGPYTGSPPTLTAVAT